MRRRNKYNARRIKTPDGLFDSEKEFNRWCQLKSLQNAGIISGLQRQIHFELSPAVKDGKGKSILRKCEYVADFIYIDEDNSLVVEDAKGFKTKEYQIKKKWMYDKHHILIQEV